MSQIVGFDRSLRLDWLDATAGASSETEDIEQIRDYLHEYLAEIYPRRTTRQKIITILTRIWARIPDSDRPVRDRAFMLLPALNQEDRFWLHWGMCLLAYPFFRDVVRTAGLSLRYYGSFSNPEITQKMSETWGERTTVSKAVPRVIKSMNNWGVIAEYEQRGRYKSTAPLSTLNKDMEIWLLKVVLCANPYGSVPVDRIYTLPELFPFSCSLSISDILESREFEVSQAGINRLALQCSMREK